MLNTKTGAVKMPPAPAPMPVASSDPLSTVANIIKANKTLAVVGGALLLIAIFGED